MPNGEAADRALSLDGIPVATAPLERADLFAGLGHGELVAAAALMSFRSFEPGEVICREGEPGESMFVIVDGLVHLLVAMAEQPELRTRSIFDEGRLVAKLRPGDVVGTGALLTGELRSATAKAAVATGMLELGREDFARLVAASPRVLENLSRILSRRLSDVTARHARGAKRGEAVAVSSGELLSASVPAILEAAVAAAPGSVGTLDARSSPAEALAAMDAQLREHRTVVLITDLDQSELPQLLQYVDRTLALAGSDGEAERALALATRHAPRGQPLDVALADGVAASLQDDDSVRLVRRIAPNEAGTLSDAEIAWLGRHVAATKLGLALGAGGAKGYAHVGVLAVLEEAGYAVDFVSGASIGAIVGTWIAFGRGAGEIEADMRTKFTPERVAETFKIALSGKSSGYDAMVQMLEEVTAGRSFGDCVIPLAVMAADLTDRRPAVLREGSLQEALLAATALAGMFPPHDRDGHRLVDGLAIDPVPTAALVEDGADVTVAVNVIGRKELPAWPGQDPPPAPEAQQRGSRMLDTLLEVMDLAQLDTSERSTSRADIGITPVFGPGSWRDFQLADLYLAAGREAAKNQLPALRALARPQRS